MESRQQGSVQFKVDDRGWKFWINQRQLTMWQQGMGDRLRLQNSRVDSNRAGELLKVLVDSEKAKADLSGR
jgi:hypothetical protein